MLEYIKLSGVSPEKEGFFFGFPDGGRMRPIVGGTSSRTDTGAEQQRQKTAKPAELLGRLCDHACGFFFARSALAFSFIFTLRLRCFCETFIPFLFIDVYSLCFDVYEDSKLRQRNQGIHFTCRNRSSTSFQLTTFQNAAR